MLARYRRHGDQPRGQSMVEFGLMLPVLIIFLLGVADLGRVFADGITLEASVRNSAEAAAQEYLQLCVKTATVDPLCDNGLSASDYNALHSLALEVGCREGERLTNRQVTGGGACTNPLIAVCVHDNVAGDASSCGQEGTTGNPPSECYTMNDADRDGDSLVDYPWDANRFGPADGRPYVEVRICYEFAPLLPTTGLWWGSLWLRRENDFAVTNY